MDTSKAILDEVDWNKVYKKLTACASFLAREMPVVFDGISRDDLVGETLLAYFSSDNGLNYSPLQGSLETFLCSVLKNKFLVHARRAYRFGGWLDDREFRPERRAPVGSSGVASCTLVERIKTVARGDRELEELISATQNLESETKVNQQLSDQLNTTIEDVVNRKKRLVRRLERAAFDVRKSEGK